MNDQPQRPPIAVKIADNGGDFMKIKSSGDLIAVGGAYDVWYFTPEQALRIVQALLGFTSAATGQSYVSDDDAGPS
jgi:hypothetical protein